MKKPLGPWGPKSSGLRQQLKLLHTAVAWRCHDRLSWRRWTSIPRTLKLSAVVHWELLETGTKNHRQFVMRKLTILRSSILRGIKPISDNFFILFQLQLSLKSPFTCRSIDWMPRLTRLHSMQVATEQGTWPFMTKVQKESGRFSEIKRAVIKQPDWLFDVRNSTNYYAFHLIIHFSKDYDKPLFTISLLIDQ